MSSSKEFQRQEREEHLHSLSYTIKTIECKMLFDSQITEKNQAYSTYYKEENEGGKVQRSKKQVVPKLQGIHF